MEISFKNLPVGPYSEDTWRKQWPGVTKPRGVAEGRLSIVDVGGEHVLSQLKARSWHCLQCISLGLCFHVSVLPHYIAIYVNMSSDSASPQIYFDPEDSFRRGHAISAG